MTIYIHICCSLYSLPDLLSLYLSYDEADFNDYGIGIGNSDEEVSRKYWMIRSVYMLQCALDDFDDYQALIHNTQSQYTLTIYSHWYSLTL